MQYSIRLLLPRGSLLLDHPDLTPHLGPWDDERLTYTWRAADPAADALHQEIATIVEAGAEAGEPAQRELVLLRGANRVAGGTAQVLTKAR